MLKLLFVFGIFTSTSFASEFQPFIFGGNNATRGQFKYFGSLRYLLNGAEVHGCGASILSTRWSLTAAHCINFELDDQTIDGLDLMVGTVELLDPGTRYNIVKLLRHPSFLMLDLSPVGIHWILNE
jgi:secreted trypsin-like serine protease